MLKLDEIDHRLLTLLQDDAKPNVKILAEKLNITKTPVYERIKRYEREGLIEKYVAVLDRSKLDASMVVFCSILLENQKLATIKSFGKAISDIPEVIECYLLGGSNDFLLKVVVRDLDAYHQLASGKLAALSNVAQIKSSFVLNQVKNSTVYPVKA